MYISELRETISNGKTFYYVRKCGVFSRISKKEYQSRVDSSFRSDTFYTILLKNKVQQHKTIYMNR